MANLSRIYNVREDDYNNLIKTRLNVLYDNTYLYQVESHDTLLWRNSLPLNEWPEGQKAYFSVGTNMTQFKYLVYVIGITNSKNDCAGVFKYLNPLYPGNISTRKGGAYFFFVSDVGSTWERRTTENGFTSSYVTFGAGGYHSSSGTYTSNNGVCIPLEIWGTNNL